MILGLFSFIEFITIIAAVNIAFFVIMYWAMGPEGRHHVVTKLVGGETFIELERTGGLRLHRVKTKVDHLKIGKTRLYEFLDLITLKQNEEDKDKQQYNRVLSHPNFWAGSKTPVRIGYPLVGFASNPNLLKEITLAEKKHEQAPFQAFLKEIKGKIDNTTQKIDWYMPLDIAKLKEYIYGSSAEKQRKTWIEGTITGEIDTLKPERNVAKYGFIIVGLAAIVIIIFLFQSGFFQNLIPK